MEWVLVCHPDLPETETSPNTVTKDSYEIMKENGWRLHNDSHKATKKASKEK